MYIINDRDGTRNRRLIRRGSVYLGSVVDDGAHLFYLTEASGNYGQLISANRNSKIQFNYNLKANIDFLQSKLRNGSY